MAGSDCLKNQYWANSISPCALRQWRDGWYKFLLSGIWIKNWSLSLEQFWENMRLETIERVG